MTQTAFLPSVTITLCAPRSINSPHRRQHRRTIRQRPAHGQRQLRAIRLDDARLVLQRRRQQFGGHAHPGKHDGAARLLQEIAIERRRCPFRQRTGQDDQFRPAGPKTHRSQERQRLSVALPAPPRFSTSSVAEPPSTRMVGARCASAFWSRVQAAGNCRSANFILNCLARPTPNRRQRVRRHAERRQCHADVESRLPEAHQCAPPAGAIDFAELEFPRSRMICCQAGVSPAARIISIPPGRHAIRGPKVAADCRSCCCRASRGRDRQAARPARRPRRASLAP